MKVTISFKPEETKKSQTLVDLLKAFLSPVRVHNGPQKGEYLHTYISTKQIPNSRS